ncbi:hypothetical protein B296_00052025 [Ensete ventricosum]|uniref:Uncharacterized protein n=1 Tax=Ensete ventricosum TaxID=4639 RepID=A0A426XUW3_ENSVE|nr:hypothetical protein B296_00052025 [Ensete ventricosum]
MRWVWTSDTWSCCPRGHAPALSGTEVGRRQAGSPRAIFLATVSPLPVLERLFEAEAVRSSVSEMWYIRDDCLEHSCYGLDLVGQPLKSLGSYRFIPLRRWSVVTPLSSFLWSLSSERLMSQAPPTAMCTVVERVACRFRPAAM